MLATEGEWGATVVWQRHSTVSPQKTWPVKDVFLVVFLGHGPPVIISSVAQLDNFARVSSGGDAACGVQTEGCSGPPGVARMAHTQHPVLTWLSSTVFCESLLRPGRGRHDFGSRWFFVLLLSPRLGASIDQAGLLWTKDSRKQVSAGLRMQQDCTTVEGLVTAI